MFDILYPTSRYRKMVTCFSIFQYKGDVIQFGRSCKCGSSCALTATINNPRWTLHTSSICQHHYWQLEVSHDLLFSSLHFHLLPSERARDKTIVLQQHQHCIQISLPKNNFTDNLILNTQNFKCSSCGSQVSDWAQILCSPCVSYLGITVNHATEAWKVAC